VALTVSFHGSWKALEINKTVELWWVELGLLELMFVKQIIYRPKLKGLCSEAHIFVAVYFEKPLIPEVRFPVFRF